MAATCHVTMAVEGQGTPARCSSPPRAGGLGLLARRGTALGTP
jgi:hypothetical protein